MFIKLILIPFLKNMNVVDNSKVCTEIQWLPAARLPGAFGIFKTWGHIAHLLPVVNR